MEDREIKKLLSTTKMKAEDKLKARIIHQINSEKVLIQAKRKSISTTSGNHFSTLGIMYILLLSLTGYFYYKTDGNLFQSSLFILYALFIASTFSIYWFITVYYDYKKLQG